MSKEGVPESEPKKIDRRKFVVDMATTAAGVLLGATLPHETEDKDSGWQFAHERLSNKITEIIKQREQTRFLNKLNDAIKTKYYKLRIQEFVSFSDKNNTGFAKSLEGFLNSCIFSDKIENSYSVSTEGSMENFCNADLEQIYDVLQTLPSFAIKKSGFKKIILAPSMPGSTSQMNESEMRGLFLKGYSKDSIYHEITHVFNINMEKETDVKGWTKLNEGARPYQNAIIDDPNSPPDTDSEDIPGYSNRYAWRYGIWEDKAMISQALFSKTELIEQIERTKKDEILKRKLEFMAGCRIEDGQFGKTLDEEEYKALGFPRISYWPEWSKDKNGKVWMDADYFNAILEGKKVTFREENGETIREISEK